MKKGSIIPLDGFDWKVVKATSTEIVLRIDDGKLAEFRSRFTNEREAAKALGISQPTLNRYLNGAAIPARVADRLAKG